MAHKSQFFPSSSCDPLSVRPAWGNSPVHLPDVKLVNPWIDYDATVRPGLARGLKWKKVLGIGLATAVSASIWTGIVLAVTRFWR